MEELNRIDWDEQPKISFDELRQQVLLDLKLAPKRIELLKALFYYSKDSKLTSFLIYSAQAFTDHQSTVLGSRCPVTART